MSQSSRRHFMQRGIDALAAAWAATGLANAAAADENGSTPSEPLTPATMRTLGNTGLQTSLLGIGTGTSAWNGSSAQNRQGHEAFLRVLIHAHERGIRYYDLADMYGAHTYVRDAMREGRIDRENIFLLTKTVAEDADTLRADLDRFRQEADTDYFDVVLLHCMRDKNWNKTLAPCMDVLSEAKEQGIIRAHGVSCHDLGALKTASREPWVDIMLNRINPRGVKMDGPPARVLPVLRHAKANGKGMLGMKIAGEGQLKHMIEESFAYALESGCIDSMTVGYLTPEEVDDTFAKLETAIQRVGAVA